MKHKKKKRKGWMVVKCAFIIFLVLLFKGKRKWVTHYDSRT